MEKLTFFRLAEKVLAEEGKPLTAREIWDIGQQRGYDKLIGSEEKLHGRLWTLGYTLI